MKARWLLVFGILIFAMNTVAQDSINTRILDQVNNARQDSGVAPLVFNDQLQSAAQQHSNDMASVDLLSHIGTDGSQFWERMQAAGYNLSAGAENVLSRADTNPEAAFRQWYNSEPHRVNMLSGTYIEVGIAYARATTGRMYFTMVLGSRTDFVTPTMTPTNTATPTLTAAPTIPPAPTTIPTIQATNTPFVQATVSNTPAVLIATNTPIPTATEYIPPEIRLIYDDSSLLLINVSGRVLNLANLVFESDSGVMSALRWNTEFLSQSLSGFTNNDCLQVWTIGVNYLNTPEACRYRHAWIAVANDVAFWRNTTVFTVRNGEDLVGVCLVESGECDVNISTPIDDISVLDPLVFSQLPDLRLEYPDSSFTLINVSGRALDLSGLVFRSDSGTLTIETWDNGFLSQALTNFADGGCLQAWTLGYPNQSPPDRCEIRHAWVLVNDSGDFWRQTDNFTVEREGILIGRCFIDETSCSVSLSANFGEVNIP